MYTPAEQDEAATEMAALGATSNYHMIPRMMGDYMVMRDQSRACAP